MQNLSAHYGGIQALRDVDLHVAKGEMVALIGSNGAGKSTLLNVISGVVKSAEGSVKFSNGQLLGTSPWIIARSGLLQVPEGRLVLPDMTAIENLQLGTTALHGRESRWTLEHVFELFPILHERQSQRAGSMSGGQQQMLAIARALMGNPLLLLLDEPSLGLAPVVVQQVFGVLRKLNAAGLTILLVEQNAKLAFELTNRTYVLEQGRVVREGESARLAADPSIREHYLGIKVSL